MLVVHVHVHCWRNWFCFVVFICFFRFFLFILSKPFVSNQCTIHQMTRFNFLKMYVVVGVIVIVIGVFMSWKANRNCFLHNSRYFNIHTKCEISKMKRASNEQNEKPWLFWHYGKIYTSWVWIEFGSKMYHAILTLLRYYSCFSFRLVSLIIYSHTASRKVLHERERNTHKRWSKWKTKKTRTKRLVNTWMCIRDRVERLARCCICIFQSI